MHLLLTDRLTCSRCGPQFGLILLADRMEDRTVVDGTLGCPNCRDAYPVVNGFGDLRAPPRTRAPQGRAGDPGASDPEAVQRLAALLGVPEGPGTLVLVGAVARHAQGLSELVPGIDVVAVDGDMARWAEVHNVSRIVSRPGLPFYSQMLRGVGVDGGLGTAWIEEAARVTARLGRVVVVDAPEDAGQILEAAGMSVLAQEPGTVVAARA